MACDAITVSRFKQLKPQFSSVDDAVAQSYIDLAQVWAAGPWTGAACEAVQAGVTCHLMTLDGLGTDAESRGFRTGHARYQSVRSAELTVTRFRDAAQSAGNSTSEWFSQTTCGRLYLSIMRRFSSGPLVATGGLNVSYSGPGYTKDAWWG